MRDMARDEYFMGLAVKEAEKCMAYDEVPVGAVIVRGDSVIAACGNGRERERDATSHAETAAISAACRTLGGWRLVGCELFVTLEPCPMCTGAIINSRVPTVIIGARDPKGGAMGSVCDLCAMPFNHKPEAIWDVRGEECAELLRRFFREKRERGTRWKKNL